MGLLDQTNNGKSYLDYYRNYRGPTYNWEWAKQTTAPTTTAAQAQTAPVTQQNTGNGGDGDSFSGSNGFGSKYGTSESEERVGGVGTNNGRDAAATALGLAMSAAMPSAVSMGMKASSTLFGTPTAKDISRDIVDAIAGPSPYGDYSFSPSVISAAMASMDAQAAENDANRGGYDAFSDSQSLADAVASGNWGGSADSDSYGGGYSGGSYGGLGGDFGGAGPGDAGWKKGGMIKNRRGLLDGEETSDAKTFKGLLSGPITDERDNIPAVNKTTGEKIAVESGEFVMTRKAVQKKGAKFFEKINKDAEKG